MPVSCFWVWQKSPAPGGPFLISAAHRMWCSGSPLVPEAENRWYVGSLSRSSPVSPLSYPHHEAGSYGQVPSVRSLLSAGSGVYSCRSESPTALSSVPCCPFYANECSPVSPLYRTDISPNVYIIKCICAIMGLKQVHSGINMENYGSSKGRWLYFTMQNFIIPGARCLRWHSFSVLRSKRKII